MPLEQPVIRIGFVSESLNSTFFLLCIYGLGDIPRGRTWALAGGDPWDRQRAVSVADCSELTEYIALSVSKVSPRLSATGLRA
jgi:hypothetical protein